MKKVASAVAVLLFLAVITQQALADTGDSDNTAASMTAWPSWLSVVSQQTTSMVITSDTTIDYYCDHCGSTIPLARAVSWTGKGRDLEGIRVSLLQDGVAYYIQLRDTDELGPFEYIVGVADAEDSIHIHFVPGSESATVTHRTPTIYEDIAFVTGAHLYQGSNWIAGFISYDVMIPFISRSHLGLIRFDFHMAKDTVDNRELFVFDVTGWATKP